MRRRTAGFVIVLVHLFRVIVPPGSRAQAPEESRAWDERLHSGRLAYENLGFAETSRILQEIVAGLSDLSRFIEREWFFQRLGRGRC